MFHVEDLSFRYDKNVKLLEHLSFSASGGDIVWIKGANGCGKTTLLRIIAQLVPAQSKLYLKDKLIENRAELLRHLTYIPSEPYLFDYLTGKENAHFLQKLFDVNDKQFSTSFGRMIEQFQMSDALDQFVEQYSLGMRHKLYWSAVFARESSILLLDEPFSALDDHAQQVAITILKHKAAAGTVILFTSHLAELSNTVATRSFILSKGALVEEKNRKLTIK